MLAAEDNEINRLVLAALLSQAGVSPTLVENGQLALEAWERQDWDVILMDIQMPIMDGVAATCAIRARERETGRARTPIIAVTANAMTHQVAEYEAAGMDSMVPKPIDIAALFQAMELALEPDYADTAPAASAASAAWRPRRSARAKARFSAALSLFAHEHLQFGLGVRGDRLTAQIDDHALEPASVAERGGL